MFDNTLLELDDDDLVSVIRFWERAASLAAAGQLAAIAELARRRPRSYADGGPAGHVDAGDPLVPEISEFAVDEVAAALRLSRVAAGARLHVAVELTRLPAVAAALADGVLDLPKARAVVDVVATLDTPTAVAVADHALPRAGRQTTGQLRASLSRAATAADPAAAEKRHERAVAGRQVTLEPSRDGMAELRALLPADAAVAVYQRIDGLARGGEPAGRTMDARRADALVTAVLSPAAASASPGAVPAATPLASARCSSTSAARATAPSPAGATGSSPDAATATSSGGATTTSPARTAGTSPARAIGTSPAGAIGTSSARATGTSSARPTAACDGGPAEHSAEPVERSGRLTEHSGGPAERSGRLTEHSGGPAERSGRLTEHSGGPAECSNRPTERSGGPIERSGRLAERSGGPAERAPVIRAAGVHVTVAASTAVGLDDQPGELAGYGPVPASMARQLAAGSPWRKVSTDPDTGAVVEVGRTAYSPSAALADLVRTRDRTCRFPGCRQPARRCDLDHVIPWPDGPTTAGNLAALCRHHHRLKHQTRWTVRAGPGGELRWTSPAGQSYSTTPLD